MDFKGKLPIRFSSGLRAGFVTCLALGAMLGAASGADAYSTSYAGGVGCLTIQTSQHAPNPTGNEGLQSLLDSSMPAQTVGDKVIIPHPQQVSDYSGTANLYWAPYVRMVNNTTGESAEALATNFSAKPYAWVASNGLLSNLWWNDQAPGTHYVEMVLPTGYTLYVWGATYWLNSSGNYFYKEYSYLGYCRV